MFYTVSARRTATIHILFAFLFCFTFICGFLFGIYVATQNAACYSLFVCIATASPPNTIGLFLRLAVIFALTAMTLGVRRTCFFLLLSAEAFTYGISATAVYFAYGSSQWLICWLFLFSRTIMLISLVWFWSRNTLELRDTAWRDFLLAFFISAFATIMDLYLISPHLPELFV